MEQVALEWHGPFPVGENGWAAHDLMDETMGIYLFLDSSWDDERQRWFGHELLRVGLTFDQSFADRLSQYKYDDVGRWLARNARGNLTVKVARVAPIDQGRITYPLVADIENLLIAALQPPGNIQGTRSYTGRELEIINSRKFSPLPEVLSTDDLR